MSASDSEGDDRRASRRHPVEIPIELSAGTEMAIHLTSDLSGKGAFFKRAIPHAVGSRVQLRIELPGDKAGPIECEGEVVNVPDKKNYGMGVKFLDLPRSDERRIEVFAARFGKGR